MLPIDHICHVREQPPQTRARPHRHPHAAAIRDEALQALDTLTGLQPMPDARGRRAGRVHRLGGSSLRGLAMPTFAHGGSPNTAREGGAKPAQDCHVTARRVETRQAIGENDEGILEQIVGVAAVCGSAEPLQPRPEPSTDPVVDLAAGALGA